LAEKVWLLVALNPENFTLQEDSLLGYREKKSTNLTPVAQEIEFLNFLDCLPEI
jgi:hypothetical protein